jgi:hypothetical protein
MESARNTKMRTHAKALASGEELHQPAQPMKALATAQQTDVWLKELLVFQSQQALSQEVITALKPPQPANAPETKVANLITMPAER